jgi:hypothetical protein
VINPLIMGALYASVGARPDEMPELDEIIGRYPRPTTPQEAVNTAMRALQELRERNET